MPSSLNAPYNIISFKFFSIHISFTKKQLFWCNYQSSPETFFIVYKAFIVFIVLYLTLITNSLTPSEFENPKGGSRHKNWCMARVLSYLIRYFSNYYTLHRSDLAAWAAPLDPRLNLDTWRPETKKFVLINQFMRM